MQFAKLDENQYLIRIHKDEEILTVLKKFAHEQEIQNASFSAIGSLKNPTLAYYQVDEKKFVEKEFTGYFELLSSLGTIALYDDDNIIHTHVSLSDEQFHVIGGHLIKATVSATVELTLTMFPTSYKKIHDEETGLKLWKLD